MARFLHDQNKVVLLHESGTYATASGSGVWVGQVQTHSIDDEEGKIENRFLGTQTRSYDGLDQGPRDVTGTLEMHPQDMRLMFWAIGSNVDTSGATYSHISTQLNTDARQSAFTSGPLNPPISFTLEDSKQSPGTGRNFNRTVNGCVLNTISLTATQGEKVMLSADYIGQTLSVGSGATTSVTEVTGTPYLWSSASLNIAGSDISTTKEVSIEINNNLEAPHYLNGSRDIATPFPGNRENTLSVTLDWDGNDSDFLYNDLYKDNTQFNATLDLNQDVTATGSKHAIFFLSGCRMLKPDVPSANEGPTEVTFDIMAEKVIGSSFDTTAYNPF